MKNRLIQVSLTSLVLSLSLSSLSPRSFAVGPEDGVSRPVDSSQEGAGEEPGLDRTIILKVIQSHMEAVKYCYDKELRKDPALSGVVVTQFDVGGKGNVTSAAIEKTTLNNKEVESCLVTEIQTWVFPEPRNGEPFTITYPFKFKATP